MKVICPVCNMGGILEQRGNSQRVLHYRGISNGKRLYEKHKVEMGVNGNKAMGINNPEPEFFSNNEHGLFVQSGKTSPSRGEDHRFKSGTAHHHHFFLILSLTLL